MFAATTSLNPRVEPTMATDAVTAARYAASALAAGFLTAVLAAYFAPLGTAGADPASDAGWTLPERRARFSEADVVKLRNSHFLGISGEEAEAGAPRWRLAGVAREGRGWQAMVVDDASPLQVRRMSEGERQKSSPKYAAFRRIIHY